MMKLSDLPIGQQATIIDFVKDEISIKLMEMGLVPGEVIYVEKLAPLGDPISIAVAGYSLSLRLDEANTINVEPSY
jgi:ferrous iron transport protein A